MTPEVLTMIADLSIALDNLYEHVRSVINSKERKKEKGKRNKERSAYNRRKKVVKSSGNT